MGAGQKNGNFKVKIEISFDGGKFCGHYWHGKFHFLITSHKDGKLIYNKYYSLADRGSEEPIIEILEIYKGTSLDLYLINDYFVGCDLVLKNVCLGREGGYSEHKIKFEGFGSGGKSIIKSALENSFGRLDLTSTPGENGKSGKIGLSEVEKMLDGLDLGEIEAEADRLAKADAEKMKVAEEKK